jgi:hypothetical protein
VWICNGFNADPDPVPALYVDSDPNPDPDPGSQTNADPDQYGYLDPGQTLKSILRGKIFNNKQYLRDVD